MTAEAAAAVPAHVPDHLVRDFDYLNTGGEPDFYVAHKRAQDDADVFWTPRHGGHWVVTRYADMHEIIGDARRFSSSCSSLPRSPTRLLLLESDPPIHTDYRRIFLPFLTPGAVGRLEQRVREVTVSLIEGFRGDGGCDFTAGFAEQMPVVIVMSLLDLPPDDQPRLVEIADGMVRGGDEAALQRAFTGLAEYVAGEVLPARRARAGTDIFSAMLAGRVEGGRALGEAELVTLGCLMVAAGLETVASMLGFVALFLAEHPDHRRRLVAHPASVPEALEELMRRFHITVSARVVTGDCAVGGAAFRAGDVVQLLGTVAGLDERRYPDPWTVDFSRPEKRHLVFGRGPHQCVGAFLARTELTVWLQEWLARIPEFGVAEGMTPVLVPGKTCGMRSLKLAW
jgi:cytochrome P450